MPLNSVLFSDFPASAPSVSQSEPIAMLLACSCAWLARVNNDFYEEHVHVHVHMYLLYLELATCYDIVRYEYHY